MKELNSVLSKLILQRFSNSATLSRHELCSAKKGRAKNPQTIRYTRKKLRIKEAFSLSLSFSLPAQMLDPK